MNNVDDSLLIPLAVHLPNAGPGNREENVGVENAIRAKMQGWNIQEWKMRE